LSLRDAFRLLPLPFEINGVRCQLRRPTALDFVDAIQESQQRPQSLYAWFAYRHLIDMDGKPVFVTVQEALDSDGKMIWEIGKAAEQLYEEGRD